MKIKFHFYNFYSNVQLFNASLIFYVILYPSVYIYRIHHLLAIKYESEFFLSCISEVEGGKKTKSLHNGL